MCYLIFVWCFYFMWKVPKYIAIKYMCEILYKRSKEWNVEDIGDTLYRFQCIKCYVCRRRRRWCLQLLRNTVCRVQISCRRRRRYSVLCIQWPLAPPGGKACCSRPSCGFSGSPPCSPRRQLCPKMFWDLSNYKGDCRQDAQPIPNS